MCQLQIKPLQVQIRLLVLPHAIDFLVLIHRFKPHGQVVVPSLNGLKLPGLHLDGAALCVQQIPAVPAVLFQKQPPVCMINHNLAKLRNFRTDLPVDDPCPLFRIRKFYIRLPLTA